MKLLRALTAFSFFFIAGCFFLQAQQETGWEFQALNPNSSLDYQGGIVTWTNGGWVRHGDSQLTAESGWANQDTGEAVATGHVRIQRDDGWQWVGEHIGYNFKTHEMTAGEFRSGQVPVFVAGKGLHGDVTNQVYIATNGLITADDVSDPAIKVRATRLKIIPGVRIEAWNAVLYLDGVPVFYTPYYTRNLGAHANNFNFTPGYRTSFGPFLLGNYTWYLNEQLDGVMHMDYREKRGVGAGPDFNYHLGRWGDGSIKYYYLQDQDPAADDFAEQLRENRQRANFSYLAEPFTNLEARSQVRYQSDAGVVREFFGSEYHENPQPSTYLELDKYRRNLSLDVYTQPRIDKFYETVERLPEARLTGFRQQVGNTPFYYESQSSAGYYQRLFAQTNSYPSTTNFYAPRADTFHQITLPETFFGWLDFTPRAGGRFTYYGQGGGPAGTNSQMYREVFNTGAEISFKASHTWPAVTNGFFRLDGLRHIIEPSINYVYIPNPNHTPNQLPQFDYQLQSLEMLPIEFPDYNSIDSIEGDNVLRFGLGNKFQTKRNGRIEDFLSCQVDMDWYLRPDTSQTTYGDIYSDLSFRPRSWITFDSKTRYDIDGKQWRMALHTLTLQPNDRWNWSIGHYYLRSDTNSSPTALGPGNNLINTRLYYRLNENWGFSGVVHFEASDGRLEEMIYTIYRDFRSWTGALSFGTTQSQTGPTDFTVAFTFSLKASPKYGVGNNPANNYSLLGR